MRKLFCILILALTSSLAYAQRLDQIELPCPAGSSPVFWGTSFNVSTGKYRQWLCSDNNGNIFVNTSSIASTGAINITAGGTNQNITLTPSGMGAIVIGGSGDVSVTAAGTGLTLEELNDQFGAVSLSLENRNGLNGGAFRNANLDTVDLGFLGDSGAQLNLRFEHRSQYFLSPLNVTGEFQFFNPTGSVYLGAIGQYATIFLEPLTATTYKTVTNCASAASPAVCGSAAAGHFVIAASATSVVVDTTAVTANSEILINEDQTQGTNLGVTCNTGISSQPVISAVTPGTSFTVTISAGLVTNPVCYGYSIIN